MLSARLRGGPAAVAELADRDRELLYTAVIRARKELILVGTEEAVRSAVQRLVAPASGLGERV